MLLHTPQWAALLDVLTSHPFAPFASQFANPLLHASWHCPPSPHEVIAFTGAHSQPFPSDPSQLR